MREFSIKLTVDAALVSNAYKHVHHADTLRFLEQARMAYMKAIDFSQESLFERGIFLVIASITVQYKREIKGGTLQVFCENPRLKGRGIVLEQRILNEDGKLAVTATVESMMLDTAIGRAIFPPADFVRAFSE
jgi:YbgC/YbaW family acyl-CoA thioester hydrolase